jgi:hypothetical protein
VSDPVEIKQLQVPPYRRLRGYALDPVLAFQMDTAKINQVIFRVPWEGRLLPGPAGEYVEVVDRAPRELFKEGAPDPYLLGEPGNDEDYIVHPPVNLNDEHLIAQDGVPPSVADVQFHQQMAYAVVMTTITTFERALGRRVLWAPRRDPAGGRPEPRLRLRIYPHAMREYNAFYDPAETALVLGYFRPRPEDGKGRSGKTDPIYFTCLSHDIIAHETTHAIVDGLHPRFAQVKEGADNLSFHEAFADLVAFLQHFLFPEVVRHEIARTRGELEGGTLLSQIASEFGRAIGLPGALRDAAAKAGKGDDLHGATDQEPHRRGLLLVRAVYSALVSIYRARSRDLLRIASGGTGVLPEGNLQPDLVNRLAEEAAKVAEQMLNLCIRALDYCPPGSIRFGDFLRALITADYDLFPEDEQNYRVALIEAFRTHDIFPGDVFTLSLDSLRWPTPAGDPLPDGLLQILWHVAREWDLSCDRRSVFDLLLNKSEELQAWISKNRKDVRIPGLDLSGRKKIVIHSIRPVRRVRHDGRPELEAAVEIACGKQERSLLVNLESGRIRYVMLRQTGKNGDVSWPEVPAERQPPPIRRLRGYAFDPSLNSGMDTAVMNQVTFTVRWERGEAADKSFRGPVGEYLEVVDYDPASRCFYDPVSLNDSHLLGQDGLPPSEGNPQFHQQMVYAVAMTIIQQFERALGRRALWSPRRASENDPEEYVPRLRIYPHAVREANAFYSPSKKALLFGYFPASVSDSRDHLPGGTVFTCLSHDVVAHETTHALLDGLHPRFAEASNPDTLAFHEAFADLVALFQHFTYPEVLRHQIARTRGELDRQNLLGQLAQQFGKALGGHGALRDTLGREDENGVWQPAKPDPRALDEHLEPHDRGSVLVTAVFNTFLAIYKSRIEDLVRIATNGTGVLPQGDLHPDLVNRLAGEAAKSAQHVLTMCIRALDYCPPVDITFGDYLRGLITADFDLVPDDSRGYRVAVIEAFRRCGIYPRDVRTLSVESLRWHSPQEASDLDFKNTLQRLAQGWSLTGDRRKIFDKAAEARQELKGWLKKNWAKLDEKMKMGIDLSDPEAKFEVHSVRPTRRIGPDGQSVVEMVVEITQERWEPLFEGEALAACADEAGCEPADRFCFRGGCTLLADVETGTVRYLIVKDITNTGRLRRQREFLQGGTAASLRATYFGDLGGNGREPFAMLHRSIAEDRP